MADINSKATLGALLAEGATVNNWKGELTFAGFHWSVDPRLVDDIQSGREFPVPVRGGWCGYRVAIEMKSGLHSTNTIFLMKTDALFLLARGNGFLEIDSGAVVRHTIEEVDVPWSDYYRRFLDILRGLNKTRLKRMQRDLLISVALDLHRFAYGISSYYLVRYNVLERAGFCLLNGEEYTTYSQAEFIDCLLALRAAALVRHEAIAKEI